MHSRFGKIKVIPGEDRCRFPHCTSVLIDDDVKALIDPGAGLKTLTALKQSTAIDLVINTHYHFDHMAYNYLFDRSRILINNQEALCFRDKKILAAHLGMEEVYGAKWIEAWIGRIADPETAQSPYSPQNRHEWWLSTSRLDGDYQWGEIMDFGKTKMEIIGTPGHSRGFSCLNFPGHGVMYVADIDLTDFGPWYAGSDGDIDLFAASCEKIKTIDCEYFITGHEKGVLNRKDFLAGLERFIHVIEARDGKILCLLRKPMSLAEIVACGLIYGSRYHADAWVFMWETITIKKHIRRLIDQGRVRDLEGRFVATES